MKLNLLKFAGTVTPILSVLLTILFIVFLITNSYSFAIDFWEQFKRANFFVSSILVFLSIFVALPLFLFAFIATYLFLPAFIGGLIALPMALLWRNPKRILVLRRFHQDDSSRALKLFLYRYVSPFGHIYTLADNDIKISWHIRFPVIITQLAFLHFRRQFIRTKLGLETLIYKMDLFWLRNVNWMLSWRKVFPVNSSDDLWKDCVLSMSNKSEVIIADISILSDNILWEIERLNNENLLGKTLFITTEEKRHESMKFLREEIDIDIDISEKRVFTFDSKDQSNFTVILQEVLNVQNRLNFKKNNVMPIRIKTKVGVWAGALLPLIFPPIFFSSLINVLALFDSNPQTNSSNQIEYSHTNEYKEHINDKVYTEVIKTIYEYSPGEIYLTKNLVDDLGFDSCETVEVIMDLEQFFHIKIPDVDAEHLKTVGDIITYIKKKTKLQSDQI